MKKEDTQLEINVDDNQEQLNEIWFHCVQRLD